MRRKSARNKASSPEKKTTETQSPRKSKRHSKRRKRSTSESGSDSENEVPLKMKIVTAPAAPKETKRQEEVIPQPEIKKSSNSNSEEENPEQPVWKVQTSSEGTASGEIQKLKICLTRPPSTPERVEKSPRRRKHKSVNRDGSEERPSRRRSKRGVSPSQSAEDTSSQDNSYSQSEKEETITIVQETNEVFIGEGKLISSKEKNQETENSNEIIVKNSQKNEEFPVNPVDNVNQETIYPQESPKVSPNYADIAEMNSAIESIQQMDTNTHEEEFHEIPQENVQIVTQNIPETPEKSPEQSPQHMTEIVEPKLSSLSSPEPENTQIEPDQIKQIIGIAETPSKPPVEEKSSEEQTAALKVTETESQENVETVEKVEPQEKAVEKVESQEKVESEVKVEPEGKIEPQEALEKVEPQKVVPQDVATPETVDSSLNKVQCTPDKAESTPEKVETTPGKGSEITEMCSETTEKGSEISEKGSEASKPDKNLGDSSKGVSKPELEPENVQKMEDEAKKKVPKPTQNATVESKISETIENVQESVPEDQKPTKTSVEPVEKMEVSEENVEMVSNVEKTEEATEKVAETISKVEKTEKNVEKAAELTKHENEEPAQKDVQKMEIETETHPEKVAVMDETKEGESPMETQESVQKDVTSIVESVKNPETETEKVENPNLSSKEAKIDKGVSETEESGSEIKNEEFKEDASPNSKDTSENQKEAQPDPKEISKDDPKKSQDQKSAVLKEKVPEEEAKINENEAQNPDATDPQSDKKLASAETKTDSQNEKTEGPKQAQVETKKVPISTEKVPQTKKGPQTEKAPHTEKVSQTEKVSKPTEDSVSTVTEPERVSKRRRSSNRSRTSESDHVEKTQKGHPKIEISTETRAKSVEKRPESPKEQRRVTRTRRSSAKSSPKQEESSDDNQNMSYEEKIHDSSRSPAAEMSKTSPEMSPSHDDEPPRRKKKPNWDPTVTAKIFDGEFITTETILKLCPNAKMLSNDELRLDVNEIIVEKKKSVPKIEEVHKPTVKPPMSSLSPKDDEIDKDISNIGLNRKISIVNDEASKLQPPPSPAKNPVSTVLFITNLVRPFTLKQLQELLSRTGTIKEDGFWTDRIKSKCYVEYETEEEAEATRNALHGIQWPIGNGKKLIIDFGTVEAMQAARNPTVIEPLIKPVPEKVEEKEPELKKESNERHEKDRPKAPVREWDLGKVPQEDDRKRSRSRDRDRNRDKENKNRDRSRSERSREREKRRHSSPSNGDVTERKQKKLDEEDVPAKLMDDLFRKTKATPSIYWLPLSPEQIAQKQQERLQRMAEHKRRLEESRTRNTNNRDFGRGAPRSRRRSGRFDDD